MTRDRSATGGGLVDAALDRLLAPGAEPGQWTSDEALADLVIATRVEVLQGTRTAVRPPKKRWVVPWVVGGAVVLAGAGTTAAYQLSVPPFQTIEQGVERTSVGIPVDYVNYRDRQVRCEAFIEFTEVTDRQRQQINTLVSGTDWTGYGQRLVESIPAAQRVTVDQEAQALSRDIDADLTARTLRAVSGVAAPDPAAKGPRLTGSSMSCTEPGGQDGAP
jgi:hypothetical protein